MIDRIRMLACSALLLALVTVAQATAVWAREHEPRAEDPPAENRSLLPRIEDETPARGPLRINEPIYFVAGGGERTSARFQLSFRYRLFDEAPGDVSWLENLNFGYTQTSVWDLSSASEPFEDSSFRPSLFYATAPGGEGWRPELLLAGVEHESNGRAGPADRSIDTVFARAFWRFPVGDRDLYLGPKLYAYLRKSDANDDIEEFRGFGDYLVAYGNPEGWMAAASFRVGTASKGSARIELSHPVRDEYIPRLGGYFFAQLFSGYGETILNYDQRRDVALRFGYAIVR